MGSRNKRVKLKNKAKGNQSLWVEDTGAWAIRVQTMLYLPLGKTGKPHESDVLRPLQCQCVG